MKKVLIPLVVILSVACNDDKNSSLNQNETSTKTILYSDWTIIDVKDTYILGESLGICISSSETSNVSSVSLQMKTANNSNYVTIATSTSIAFDNVYAFKLGTCYIKAIIWTEEGSRYETEEFEFRVMGPKISDLINRSDVKNKMDGCWRNSISSEESGSRCEYGFTIQMDIESESAPTYTFIDGTANPSNECGEGAVNTIDLVNIEDEHNCKASYSVAWFHTHPPLTKCPTNSCRGVGATTQDNTSANSKKIPSVVADYSSRICGGHNRDSSYTLYYAGGYTQKL